ncbi:MAG: hypothetical protein ACI81T_002592, partial [Bacteroidia bacterium]
EAAERHSANFGEWLIYLNAFHYKLNSIKLQAQFRFSFPKIECKRLVAVLATIL